MRQKKIVKSYLREIWKQVDFDGRPTKTCTYEISNFGRIKSVSKVSGNENLLKGSIVNQGFVTLNQKLKDNSTGMIYIHRFVAENFIDEPETEDHTYILHIDYDKTNNKWNNLKWGTKEEWRLFRSKAPERQNPKPRKYKKHYKLTDAKVLMMKKMIARGTNRKRIAKTFGVAENTVYHIEKGRRWGHVKLDEKELEAINQEAKAKA